MKIRIKNAKMRKINKKIRFKKNKKSLNVGSKKISLKKRHKTFQLPNTILVDKILKGNIDLNILLKAKNKKFFNELIGKANDFSIEKIIKKSFKSNKKQKLKNEKNDNKIIFKFKKEPEKNKTHWDYLLEEMKWMSNDFEKERKLKKKVSFDMSKSCKKNLDTRHLEKEKITKKIEQDLRKKNLFMSRLVHNYWKKIEKLSKHQYNTQLQQTKIQQQQIRLLNFINKLQKISTKVADSLNPVILLFKKATNTEDISNLNNSLLQPQRLPNDEEINIILQKTENGYRVVENHEDETFVFAAAKYADKIQPKGAELSTSNVKTKVPFLIKHELREYQHIGLDWLVTLSDYKINGILADEMGLGKTIQTIALLAHLACEKGIWGPHLIIVPTTIIINWEIEFKRWCPAFKILSYYGNQKERKAKRYGWHKANFFNVCITSYKLAIQDYSIFKRKRWYFLVLDEAQNIKNFKSKRWQMLLNFKAKRKLLLTGTPLQNDIMEIWSYLHFLMPNLFFSNEDFRDWFYNPFYQAIHYNTSLNRKLIQSLHCILRPFLLRRLKKDVEKQLPEKIEHVIYCELTRRQKYLYDEYINSENTQDTLRQNDYFSIMNVLMQLRKVCNHPDIFEARDYYTPANQLFKIYYVVPYLVMDALSYNPLKSVNYKNLFLILEEYEKYSKIEYFSALECFPLQPFYQIYESLLKGEQALFTNRYIHEDGNVYLRKQYAESTIYFPPNTLELSNSINSIFQHNNSSSNYNHMHSFPKYLCPTNIPLFHNLSLSNYFEMFHPSNKTEEKLYLKSCFNENILGKKNLRDKEKVFMFHSYDLINRRGLIFKKPIFGNSISNLIKIRLFLSDIHFGKNYVYGEKKSFSLFGHILNSQILNKYAHQQFSETKLKQFNNIIINVFDGEYVPEKREAETEIPNDEIKHDHKEEKEKYKEIISKNEDNEILDLRNSIHYVNSDNLQNMVYTPQKILSHFDDLMKNFRLYIPNYISSGPVLVSSKYSSNYTQNQNKFQFLRNNLHRIPNVQKYFSLFKIISFPDKKLVEFDSGKLIKLAQLLKNLKTNKSKCLIFTQMTRMLDILEIFLNLHGYTYVRLDGSTKVEIRQQIVDRFNTDNKIFCFISSTRSGGIGLNLTGADSIVFYDTDWNPAMDKQAQDRCHRIGQTRTVHIYRLITTSTIEENIFKKSIQKRELNYVIMEDGKFDTDYFQKVKINFKSIVKEENLLKNNDNEEAKRIFEFENIKFENEEEQKNLEELLIKIEDHDDVQAYKIASKEMLDEYEKVNNEQKFFNNEDNVNLEEEAKKENIIDENDTNRLSNLLKPIDNFSLKYYKKDYTFEDFVKDKELKQNVSFNLFQKDDESGSDQSDEFNMIPSDDEEKINKMDLDKAYEMYLAKKQEITKIYENN